MKHTTWALGLLLLLSGCDSKVESAGENAVVSETQVASEGASGVSQIGAFILGADGNSAAKLFEQGARLAISGASAPAFEVKFFEAAQGKTPDSAALKALVEKEKASAVIYWSVDTIAPIAQYLRSSDTVGIVAAEVTDKIVPLGANIFGFGYSNQLTYKRLAKFAGNTLKSYRFAVIEAAESRFEDQAREFVEETKSLGNTIVFDEKVVAESADFSALIARAGKEKCDTIFAVLPSQALVRFIKAARASQFKGKLIVGDTLFSTEIGALGADAEGVYMAQSWSDDQTLKGLYSTTYGSAPDSISLGLAALGYDLVRCLQGVGTPLEASSIKYSFLSQSCEGLTGKTQFTGERVAQRGQRILVIKNGQVSLAE